MTYLAVCPACGEEISGGDVCGCDYFHLDTAGQAYTRRHAGERWQPEPNILVREKEEVIPPSEPDTQEPPPKPSKRAKGSEED